MSDDSRDTQRQSSWLPADAYFVVQKAATTVAYICVIVLTVRFFRGRLDLPFAAACIFVSGAWCFLTRVKMAHYLQTYFDVLSRLEVTVPVTLGALLSAAALLAHHTVWQAHAIAATELLLWFGIWVHYRRNRSKFEKQGYGPVPIGCWVSPPVESMSAGDLILTNGAIARRLHESVGHAATVVVVDGALFAISSHLDRGCTLEPIADVLGEIVGHYILLKLAQPLSEEQVGKMCTLANEMVSENRAWTAARNEWWQAAVDSLCVPDALKERLRKRYHCTGYDWFGLLMGRLAKHHWTCIGASLELYRRVGIGTNPYGTGLLGFGTTLFDPIMPVRFLNDPAFRLVMKGQLVPDATLLFQSSGG